MSVVKSKASVADLLEMVDSWNGTLVVLFKLFHRIETQSEVMSNLKVGLIFQDNSCLEEESTYHCALSELISTKICR